MGVVCANEAQLCNITPCNYSKPAKTIYPDQEVIHLDWADAVTKHSVVGIKGLHCENPALINATVDSYGCTAIHYAVHSTNEEIMMYLLQHDVYINAQGGPHYNTALHEAVLARNFNVVQLLYGHHINDEIRNNDNQLAIDLCSDSYLRRRFIKAKQCGLNQSKHSRLLHRQITTIWFRNRNLNETDTNTVREILRKTGEEQMFFDAKKHEIKQREKPITQFGRECGVDVDEIAMVLVDNDASRLWVKLTKNSKIVTKQTQVYKILFSLTKDALKRRYRRSVIPSDVSMRELTKKVCKMIPHKKYTKLILTKEVFVQSFHRYLFQLHAQIAAQESRF